MQKGSPLIKKIYKKLYTSFGPQGWWPGDTRLEIIAGAILTQNTAWSNVEKAILNMKRSGALRSLAVLKGTGAGKMSDLIKPAGYYNIKTKRLKNCVDFLCSRLGRRLEKVAHIPTGILRSELLKVNGIGPETADSILLYAFKRPTFVVDAYTRRIFSRHGLIAADDDYDSIQSFFMDNLPSDERLFNEYHALIVNLGKHFCRPKPRCKDCPINSKSYYAVKRYLGSKRA